MTGESNHRSVKAEKRVFHCKSRLCQQHMAHTWPKTVTQGTQNRKTTAIIGEESASHPLRSLTVITPSPDLSALLNACMTTAVLESLIVG